MSELKEFIDESLKLLQEKSDCLRERKERICKGLEEKFEEYNVTISGRVKGGKSLKEKIIRNNYYNKFNANSEKLFKELSDMVGIRINCLLTREEEENYRILKDICNKVSYDKYNYVIKNSCIEDKLYIDLDSIQPQKQKNGKDIYRIDARYRDEEIEFGVEIQIKSSINSLWGEIDHKLFYKNYEYMVSQDFYSGLMKLLYENLDSVERELELLKDHMESKEDDLEEYEEMLARLLYNTYNKEAKKAALNISLDFRTICKLVAQLQFCGCIKKDDQLDKLNESITNIKSCNKFKFKDKKEYCLEEVDLSCVSDDVERICKIINDFAQEENVYVLILINIFAIISKKETCSEAIVYLSEKLYKSIVNMFNQGVIETEKIVNEKNKKEFDSIVRECSIKYLEEKKKLEMFLSKNILLIQKFISNIIVNSFYIFKNETTEIIDKEMKDLMSGYLKFAFKLINERTINVEDLKKYLNDNNLKVVSNNSENNLKLLMSTLKEEKKQDSYIEDVITLLTEEVGVVDDKD